ncbi:DUF1707 domain-containing protein [Amycolatopsis sp. NPDC050768]|uniref:DUF1707 SHOCT-like domain-containing protein n=1 Tax=Amycolatopsis sp. NPDC050768 TaxID=3154839 RepID=UPI0033ECBFF6
MTEVPSPQLRISDQERESALNALGEHMSAGRIDIDEYGERSARITAAKTRGELAGLFDDLPAPHPVYGGAAPVAPASVPAAPPVPATAPQTAVARPDGWNGGQRAAAALVPLVWIATIALIATGTLPAWPLVIAPIALSIIGRALWGHGGGNHHNHRDRHREHRIDHREARREMRDEMRDEFRRRRDRW